jgi:hypothetical protein
VCVLRVLGLAAGDIGVLKLRKIEDGERWMIRVVSHRPDWMQLRIEGRVLAAGYIGVLELRIKGRVLAAGDTGFGCRRHGKVWKLRKIEDDEKWMIRVVSHRLNWMQ